MLQWGRDLSVAEGPPPPPPKSGCFYCMLLQWGRDLSVAEGLPFPTLHGISPGGFNGAATFRSRKAPPRRGAAGGSASFNGAATFRSRKVHARGRPGHDGNSASMGPRPFGRGRPAVSSAYSPRSICFNGAATFRSRKAEGAFNHLIIAVSFNGAATFRSRKVGVDAPTNTLKVELQWGRDLSVAEGAPK